MQPKYVLIICIHKLTCSNDAFFLNALLAFRLRSMIEQFSLKVSGPHFFLIIVDTDLATRLISTLASSVVDSSRINGFKIIFITDTNFERSKRADKAL